VGSKEVLHEVFSLEAINDININKYPSKRSSDASENFYLQVNPF